MKNAKNNLKKVGKSLEKEREKLTELEATPGNLTKEMQGLGKKLGILQVRGEFGTTSEPLLAESWNHSLSFKPLLTGTIAHRIWNH